MMQIDHFVSPARPSGRLAADEKTSVCYSKSGSKLRAARRQEFAL
jgi:hypothetical protein